MNQTGRPISMHDAAFQGNLKRVKEYIEKKGADINHTDFRVVDLGNFWFGRTKVLYVSPIFLAALKGHKEVVDYLLEKGASPIYSSPVEDGDRLFTLPVVILQRYDRNDTYQNNAQIIQDYLQKIENACKTDNQGLISEINERLISQTIREYSLIIGLFITRAEVLARSRVLKPKHLESLEALRDVINRVSGGAVDADDIKELITGLKNVKIAYLSEQTFDRMAYLSVIKSLLKAGATASFKIMNPLSTALRFGDFHVLDALIGGTPTVVFLDMLQAITQDTDNFKYMEFYGTDQDIHNRFTLLIWYHYVHTKKLNAQSETASHKRAFPLPQQLEKSKVLQSLHGMASRQAFIRMLKEKLKLNTTEWTKYEYESLPDYPYLLDILSHFAPEYIYAILSQMYELRIRRKFPTEILVDMISAPLLRDLTNRNSTAFPPIPDNYLQSVIMCNGADAKSMQLIFEREVKAFIEAFSHYIVSMQGQKDRQKAVIKLLQILESSFTVSSYNKWQQKLKRIGTFFTSHSEAQKIFDYSIKPNSLRDQLKYSFVRG